MWFEAFPVTFDVSSIYPFIYFVSSVVIFNVTPPSWSTAFATESKFTVTNSFMFKSKFLLSVLIASGASPYEYACNLANSNLIFFFIKHMAYFIYSIIWST